ncbi:hypothetical protein ACFQ07_02995 [Actinomadura adrarensis]|uniref:DUF2188 domain-containing protein n=1 Tax=Actinomadura adrarensis TaxID=1819600 RepID=A0ABW3CA57_9ACTN
MIEIKEAQMTATHQGVVIAKAVRVDGAWHATTWPRPLTRNEAITALAIAELEAANGPHDPVAASLREELPCD